MVALEFLDGLVGHLDPRAIAADGKAQKLRKFLGLPTALFLAFTVSRSESLRKRVTFCMSHSRGAKQAFSSVRLWDFHAPDWLGTVAARHQLRADAGPVRFQVGTELIDGHAVNARCAFVALDPLQGPFEVLFGVVSEFGK